MAPTHDNSEAGPEGRAAPGRHSFLRKQLSRATPYGTASIGFTMALITSLMLPFLSFGRAGTIMVAFLFPLVCLAGVIPSIAFALLSIMNAEDTLLGYLVLAFYLALFVWMGL